MSNDAAAALRAVTEDAMTEAEALGLLRYIKTLERLLEWGDCDEEQVKAELDALNEKYATEWLGG
jgi:hypothetical protein